MRRSLYSGPALSEGLMRRVFTGLSFALLMPTIAAAQDAPVDETAPETPATDVSPAEDEAQAVETIVVTGIRASLKSASDLKRNSDQIIDAINAEDIGKLPDTNVAEALQRITGVQINRELGEGSELAVRGFRQTRVEINGQTQVGAGAGGGVTFESIPSEAFENLQVVKTQSADMTEGGIGAIVRLNTRKPLSLKKPILSAGYDRQYSDRAGKYSNNGSFTAGDNFLLGSGWEVGGIVTGTFNERKLRQDFFDVRGFEAVNGFNRDLDGDGIVGEPVEYNSLGIITDLQDGAYVPAQTRLRVREQDRNLQSVTLGLAASPFDGLEFSLDGTLTASEANDAQYQYSASFNSAYRPDTNNPGFEILRYLNPNDAVISDNQTVLTSDVLGQIANNGRVTGINVPFSSNAAPNVREVATLSFGSKWDALDYLTVEARYAVGEGWQKNEQLFTTSTVANADRPFAYYDFSTANDIPTLLFVNSSVGGVPTREIFAPDGSILPGLEIDFASLNTYTLSGTTVQLQKEKNNEHAFTLDFDADVGGWGGFNTLEFGVRIANLNGKRQRWRDDSGGRFVNRSFTDLSTAYPGLVIPQPYEDLLDGATGTFPSDWITLDSRFLSDNLDMIREREGIVLQLDPLWGFRVEQRSRAAYLKGNFEGTLPWLDWSYRGNTGVRYVETDQIAQSVDETAGGFVPLEFRKTYGNWLPSASANFEINDTTFLRLGAARTMARPSLIDLAPISNIQFFSDSGTSGNPDLDPEVVSQYDISLEKYFGKTNLLSLALYQKDFDERIEEGVISQCFDLPAGTSETSPGDDGCAIGQSLIRLSVPANLGEAKVRGLELGYQQHFDFLPGPLDGLGMVANYTLINVDGGAAVSLSGLPLPVQDLSENSYNLILYYEKGPFATRAAYNWRDDFYDEKTDTNFGSFAEPYGQLDASMSYDIGKHATLSFEAINILNNEEVRYQELNERLVSYRVNDTRYVLSLRVRR